MVKVKIYLDKNYCKKFDDIQSISDFEKLYIFCGECCELIFRVINSEKLIVRDMKIKKEAKGLYSLFLVLYERVENEKRTTYKK